jgi:hypothetical protein
MIHDHETHVLLLSQLNQLLLFSMGVLILLNFNKIECSVVWKSNVVKLFKKV